MEILEFLPGSYLLSEIYPSGHYYLLLAGVDQNEPNHNMSFSPLSLHFVLDFRLKIALESNYAFDFVLCSSLNDILFQ